jgi:hypothetical protein
MSSCSDTGLAGRERCCVTRKISAQHVVAKIVDVPAAHHTPAPAAPTSSSSSQAGCRGLAIGAEQGTSATSCCCCWTTKGHKQLFAADVFFIITVD